MGKARVANVSYRKGERGNVLVYTVLSVLFLFFAVGLGADISHLYVVKTELQNAADAGALAGASALTLPITDPATSQPQRIPVAVDRAVNTMDLNKYNFNNLSFDAVMSTAAQRALVTFAVNLGGPYVSEADATANPNNIRFVRVNTPSVPVNVFFAVPLLGTAKNLDAKATSGLSVPGNLSVCIAPLSAVSCAPNDHNCSLCDRSDPLYPNCTQSKYWGKCPGADPYAQQVVEVNGPDDPDGNGLCDPKKEFCKRCTYNIRSQAQNGQGPSAGNFQILRCAGNGANAVKQALAAYGTNCPCGQVSAGDEVDTQTGIANGPVMDGLNVRFDVYGGGLNYSSTTPPDTNIAEGNSTGNGSNRVWDGINYPQYKGTGTPVVTPVAPRTGETGVGNRRVLLIPIIPITEFTNSTGSQTVHVGSLAGFFMQAQVSNQNNGDIQVEYISDDVIGVIGFDPNDTNITNIVTPVLYR